MTFFSLLNFTCAFIQNCVCCHTYQPTLWLPIPFNLMKIGKSCLFIITYVIFYALSNRTSLKFRCSKNEEILLELIWHEYLKILLPIMWSAALTNLNTFYFKFYSCFISIHKRMSRTGCRAPFKLRSVTLDISSLITFSKVMFCELICLIWKVFDP